MRAAMIFVHALGCSWLVLTMALSAAAQGPSRRGDTSVAHVPGDAWFTMVVRPRRMLEKYEKRVTGPVELMRRVVQEEAGFPLDQLDELVVVIGYNAAEVPKEGLDEGELRRAFDPDQWISMVFRFHEPMKAEELKMFGELKPAEHKGKKYFQPENEWNPSCWSPDEKTVVIAKEKRLFKIMDGAEAGMSALLHQLRRADAQADGVMVVSMETGRAFWDGVFGVEKPPLPLLPVLSLPKHLDVAVVTADLDSDEPFKLTALAINADSAKVLTEVSGEFVKTLKSMLNDNRDEILKDSPRPKMGKLMIEFSEKFLGGIELKQDGRTITGRVSAKGGLLCGAETILETFAESHDTQRRYARMNELRQVGEAIRMYQEEHGKLPPAAIVDKDGKPLLSWRVRILPHLAGGKELYDQFKLDQPWDSEHNKKLLEKMPKALAYDMKEGGTQTRYLAVVGEGTAMGDKDSAKAEDITDDGGRTLVVVEVPAKQAVPWTKPAELSTDGAFELLTAAGEEDAHFLSLSSDGDTNFIKKSKITAEALKGFFSKAGGEKEQIYQFSH